MLSCYYTNLPGACQLGEGPGPAEGCLQREDQEGDQEEWAEAWEDRDDDETWLANQVQVNINVLSSLGWETPENQDTLRFSEAIADQYVNTVVQLVYSYLNNTLHNRNPFFLPHSLRLAAQLRTLSSSDSSELGRDTLEVSCHCFHGLSFLIPIKVFYEPKMASLTRFNMHATW